MQEGVSVLVAAYNESCSVGRVCRDLKEVLRSREGPWEIIVVDDGSDDGTGDLAAAEGVTVLRHARNKGYGASQKTAARRAAYPVLVLFDSDGQHAAADVPRLLRELEGHDCGMVVGERGKNTPVKLSRVPGKKILAHVANYLAGEKIPDLNCGLRALRRDLFMEYLHILPNRFSITTTLTLALLKAGYDIRYLPVTTGDRVGRASSVSVLVDGYKTLLIIVNTIVLFNPNKVFIPASLVLFALGCLYALYTIFTSFNIASGALLLLITGLIIFFFGIVADQLSSLRRERK